MTKRQSLGDAGFLRCSIVLIALTLTAWTSVRLNAQDKPVEPQPPPTPDEPTGFPKYQDLPLPEAEALLRSRPVDWIVLRNQDVLIVDPLVIRPDPLARIPVKYEMAQRTYNRLWKHRQYKETETLSLRQFFKTADRAAEFDQREATLKSEIDAARERMESLKPATYKFRLMLKDVTQDSEFLLEIRHIEQILFFEDLLLKRADQLISAGNTSLAYDLLLLVARRHRENNDVIRAELVGDETSLVNAIKKLEEERTTLRQSKDELNLPRNKNLPAAKARLATIDKTISNIIAELKDVDDDLKSIRGKLRYSRQKESANLEPPSKDELLIPTWPRFDEVYQRLLSKDSDLHLERGDLHEAWRLLTEAWKPGAEIPGMSSRMGTVIEKLIFPCIERGDYRQARFYLRELSSREASNPVAIAWGDRLTELASSTLADAKATSIRGDAANAARKIDLAARIWPDLTGLREAHRDLNDRYQILRVGVMHLSGESSLDHLPTEADERVRLMADAQLFEPIGFTDQGVRFGSAFLDSWEPTDLGRQVRFQLKLRRSDWEARPLLTSADIHREFVARLQPGNTAYDERLAGFVEGLSIQSPTEFSVRFRQLPLRLESLWRMTVSAGDASRLLNEDSRASADVAFGRERFHREASEQGRLRYTRVRQQPATIRPRRVDEIVETRFSTWDRALQGLIRGDVALIPIVDFSDLKGLQDDGRFQVVPYYQPRSHFLMFNPRCMALNDGQLRRALLHGIPRDDFLNSYFLNSPSLKEIRTPPARVVTSPFSTMSYAYNRQLPQPVHDPSLAAALALTAKKRLGGQIPPLTMICPDEPRIRDASRAMIEEWRRIGVEVNLVDDPASDVPWDICYRTAKSVEPLTDAWPLLTMSSEARISGLQGLPDSTRRLLLELERSVDWTAATKLLHRLSAEMLTDARYIPLWEIDEFLVARRHINGIPTRLLHAYQDIERWSVQSWFSQDLQ